MARAAVRHSSPEFVDWSGPVRPAHEDVAGRTILTQGLTRIEAFTITGEQILGHAPVTYHEPLASNYRDFAVGTVHHVWGWKVLGKVAARALAKRP